MNQLKKIITLFPLGAWWVGSGVVVSIAWVLCVVLQIDILQPAQLWFGLWATYLLPGIGLSFAIQPKPVDWIERLGWIIGCSIVFIPTMLFGLTAAGLPFSPVMQVGSGLVLSLGAGIIYTLRLWYAKHHS